MNPTLSKVVHGDFIHNKAVTETIDFILPLVSNYTNTAACWSHLTFGVRRVLNMWMLIDPLFESVRKLNKK